MGLPVAPDLGMGDHHHLMSRLASLRMDPERHPYAGDTRIGLGWRGALACRRARVPVKRRAVLSLWFVLSAVLPRRAALPVVSWRLTHATRSPRVARILRAVRRLTG